MAQYRRLYVKVRRLAARRSAMWVGVLGPLRIRSGDAEVEVPAAKQRVLLAALLVRANAVVSFDELADTVWDGAPAPGARTTVRKYVLRLSSP